MRQADRLEDQGVPRQELIGIAAVLVADVCWGLGNIFVKLADTPAISFAFYRLWGGFAVYAAACVVSRQPITRRALVASAPGGLAFGAYMVALYTALRATSVADVTIIGALQPALVLLVAGPLFGERVSARDVALTIAAMGGVVLVVLGSTGTPAWSLRGDLFAVVSLLAFTGFWLATKHARSRSGVGALPYVTIASLIGSLVVTPLALTADGGLAVPHGSDWLWLVLTVLLPGTIAHFLAAWGTRFVEVWRSSLIQLGVPLVSVAAAWVALDERLGALAIIGAMVVIAALAAVIVATRRDAAAIGARAAGLAAEEPTV
jgi:drug/metabolite transporter (DMT)-like permease